MRQRRHQAKQSDEQKRAIHMVSFAEEAGFIDQENILNPLTT